MTKTDFSLENLKNVQDLIKFVDQKASALLVVYGLILALFIETAKSFFLKFPPNSLFGGPILTIFVFLLGIVLFCVLITQICYLLFFVFKPKMAQNYIQEEKSVFYYEHISDFKRSDFIKKINSLTETQMLEEINKQVFEVAKIMNTKSHKLCVTINLCFWSIGILILFASLSYLL